MTTVHSFPFPSLTAYKYSAFCCERSCLRASDGGLGMVVLAKERMIVAKRGLPDARVRLNTLVECTPETVVVR